MEEIAKQIYVETAYEGINVGAMVTPTGVICIDVPSYARDARDWAARMHRLSPYPVQHIILTDSSGDRVLNTRWLNAPIIMQYNAAMLLNSYDKRFPQALVDSLSMRNPHRGRELSTGPVEHATTNFSGEIIMFKHGQQIVLRSAGGPTDGNCWVILPERGVLFAGDTVVSNTFPLPAAQTTAAWLKSLEELRDYAKGHIIVSGRGETLQPGEPETYATLDKISDYLQTMRNDVTNHLQNDGSREGLVALIPKYLNMFPRGTLPLEWLRQQTKFSLGNVYDEVQSQPAL